MPHQVFDNRESKLLPELKKQLRDSKSADFVVGWFFLTGLRELQDEIKKLDKLRILAGSRTNQATAEIMMLADQYEELVAKRLEDQHFLSDTKIQEILDSESKAITKSISAIKPIKENIEFIKWFCNKLREGKIEIHIYPNETLHAKLYLLHQNKAQGTAFVGSSNLSLSGLALNTELNVLLPEKENYAFLKNWFDDLWAKSEKADFTEMMVRAIEESWVLNKKVTPFRVYLRLLHEMFANEDYPDAPEISKNIGEARLYDYQIDAVRDAYQRLEKFNGVFLADVPGIGKTYMGAALLAHLQEEGKRAIIIGPPKLEGNWNDVLSQLGVGTARYFSYGKLDQIENDTRLMEREIVLIDESHHFRNPVSQRYQQMERICEGKKVILVSATPQNLGPMDLYHQIKLFTPSETNHQFRIDPVRLEEFFKKCEKGQASLENLIDQIVIRRTRKDISEGYQHEKIDFPKREGPYRIEYAIDKVYPEGLYKQLNTLVESLSYSRYDIGSYAKKEAFSDDELQRLKQAGVSLKRIMKIILFRRLESSVAAFRDSVLWMKKSHEAFLRALDEGKVLIGSAAEDVYDQIRSDVELEDIEIPADATDIQKFNIAGLRPNIEKDLSVINQLQSFVSVDRIPAKDDDKLQTLIRTLQSKDISGKKMIIFTQFSSTAEYLGEELKRRFSNIEFVSLDTGNVLQKAQRFSPMSNNKKIPRSEEINILVSTEILSEGLNLQDGQVVINYELHWNPVRIIQRIGRIDRVGSKHKKIYVYNFFPQEELEAHIGVERRVKKRIDEIIKLYGADEQTISMGETEVRRRLYNIYTEQERSIEEEELKSVSHEFRQKWIRLREQFPEEYQLALSLPDLMGTGLKTKQAGVAVFCRANNYYRMRLADIEGNTFEKDDWKILPLVECEKAAKGEKIFENHYDIVEAIRQEFEAEASQREIDRMLPEKIKEQVSYRLSLSKRGKPKDFKDRTDQMIELLRKVKLTSEVRRKLRSVLRKFGKLPEELVEEIERIIIPLPFEEPTPPQSVRAQIILSVSLIK